MSPGDHKLADAVRELRAAIGAAFEPPLVAAVKWLADLLGRLAEAAARRR